MRVAVAARHELKAVARPSVPSLAACLGPAKGKLTVATFFRIAIVCIKLAAVPFPVIGPSHFYAPGQPRL